MTQSSGVAIIGGGRWARTIGDLLVKIVAKNFNYGSFSYQRSKLD